MDIKIDHIKNDSLVSAYVSGTIKAKDLATVETRISASTELRQLLEMKEQEKDFLLQLIPSEDKQSKNSLTQLRSEIKNVTEEVYASMPKDGLLKKAVKTLNKPILTIRY